MYEYSEQSLNEKIEIARELVKKKAIKSGIAAALPVPLLDLGTDVKYMTEIEDEINEVFGVTKEEIENNADSIKTRIMIMFSSGVGDVVSKFSTKAILKVISKKNNKPSLAVSKIVTHSVNGAVSYFLMKKLGDNHIDFVVQQLKK
ncbi:hypothetical protein [Nosocomiicoccus ampullae]|uniref:hypothetical protein n=1 Tax=Nosocomiicoccus ampullae TaxID=489910 RepID=UPI00254ECECB|nr:hypothetical protein [Nosocomiicoccus ampullae]MDK6863378.1 hypothetical protein [Nosocomiicoccus ampullae]